jgi:hypothetical protein
MAQSKAHVSTSTSIVSSTSSQISIYAGERKLRRISAWLLLIFLLSGELGAVWDREWHAFVGRDQFWTPPHTLIYSSVAGAGLLALMIVLLETIRYRQKKSGVDDTSTVSILRYFHAPLGFSVLGFGALLPLIAAPLDNYWHELYGIDIALWAPFHMMGVTGALVGILGIIYIFASEASIARQAKEQQKTFLGIPLLEFGAILVMASFLNFVLTGFLQFPLVTIGIVDISTYPLPLVMGSALFMISTVRLTHKPGSAMLLTLLLLLHTLLVELFVPWAIRVVAIQQELSYRPPGTAPYFRWEYALVPLALLISSLIVDGYTYWQIRHKGKVVSSSLNASILGAIIAPPIFLLTPLILGDYSPYTPVFLLEPDLPVNLGLMVFIVVFSIVVALIAGAIGGWIGSDFGDIWRWSKR